VEEIKKSPRLSIPRWGIAGGDEGNSIRTGIAMQGNQDGSFHPNALGHVDIANNYLAAFEAFVTKTKASAMM
jgi:hypothetical protein